MPQDGPGNDAYRPSDASGTKDPYERGCLVSTFSKSCARLSFTMEGDDPMAIPADSRLTRDNNEKRAINSQATYDEFRGAFSAHFDSFYKLSKMADGALNDLYMDLGQRAASLPDKTQGRQLAGALDDIYKRYLNRLETGPQASALELEHAKSEVLPATAQALHEFDIYAAQHMRDKSDPVGHDYMQRSEEARASIDQLGKMTDSILTLRYGWYRSYQEEANNRKPGAFGGPA